MKRSLLLFSILFSFTLAEAQNDSAWTLERCLKYAAENNIQIKQAQLNAAISKAYLLQSKIKLLPSINADASYNFNFGNSVNPTTYSYVQQNSQSATGGLSGSVPLFTGLQQLNNIQKSKADFEAAQQDYQNASNNVALTLTNYFLQIIVNKELLKVAQTQLEISEAQLERARAQVRAGTLAEASSFEFEAQQQRDLASVVTAKNNVALALLSLRIALQLPEKTAFDIREPAVTTDHLTDISRISSSAIFDYAAMNQPSIRAAEARVRSAMFSLRMAKGSFSPTLAASASLRSNYFDKSSKPAGYSVTDIPIFGSAYPDNSSIVGYARNIGYAGTEPISFSDQLKNNLTKTVSISLSVPIFSGWQKMTALSVNRLNHQMRSLDLENTKNTLRQDIEKAYANALASSQNFSANQKSLESAKKSFDAYDKRYAVGLANTFEVQQSKNNLLRAESQMIQAKYTYILQMKVLDFYMGKPIELK
ncbi:MAG: TolC family protein [Chitinophagales bacterium]